MLYASAGPLDPSCFTFLPLQWLLHGAGQNLDSFAAAALTGFAGLKHRVLPGATGAANGVAGLALMLGFNAGSACWCGSTGQGCSCSEGLLQALASYVRSCN